MVKKVNKLERDEYGRPSGILAIDKPAGISSHDIVNKLRKILNTKKVGHVGALDIFATGVMLYLIGKSTKLSDKLMNMDKEYETTILFGVATDTQDIEGKITEIKTGYTINDMEDIDKIISSFKGKYNQVVSVYSSVKVNGHKLRKVMRNETYEKHINYDEDNNKILTLTPKVENLETITIKIPKRVVEIFDIEILDKGNMDIKDLFGLKDDFRSIPENQTFPYLKIRVRTSKGTYIRQLAEDIGFELNMPAMLIALCRTKVGNIKIEETIKYEELNNLQSGIE